LVDISEYKLPAGNAGEYRVSEKELAMAKQLIGSMADKWQPDKFHDEFEARLGAVIKKRLKTKGALASNVDKKSDVDEDATTNVVDFMSLLQKSLASNKRTPAKASKTATKKPAKTTAKAASKSAAAKKAATRRSA